MSHIERQLFVFNFTKVNKMNQHQYFNIPGYLDMLFTGKLYI